ncbi:MAG: nuclear transport factor 2 family protein [Chloroflexota bacterium]
MSTLHDEAVGVSAADLELVRAAYDAFTRHDFPAVLAAMHPAIELVEPGLTRHSGRPWGTTFHGPDEVLEGVFHQLPHIWSEFAVVPDEFLAADNRVIVLGRYHGRGRITGKSFNVPFVHVISLSAGRIRRIQVNVDTAVLLDAAGDLPT